MGRIEHELVFCPICDGDACRECDQGRTFDAYCETQERGMRADKRDRARAMSNRPLTLREANYMRRLEADGR